MARQGTLVPCLPRRRDRHRNRHAGRRGGDALRLRGDPEYRISRHGLLRPYVRKANRGHAQDLILVRDERHGAGEFASLDEAWQKCERGDWMLWFYAKKFPDDLKGLTLTKGLCAVNSPSSPNSSMINF